MVRLWLRTPLQLPRCQDIGRVRATWQRTDADQRPARLGTPPNQPVDFPCEPAQKLASDAHREASRDAQALFLGRAVVDEVLPPAFLVSVLGALPDGSLGVSVVQAAGAPGPSSLQAST